MGEQGARAEAGHKRNPNAGTNPTHTQPQHHARAPLTTPEATTPTPLSDTSLTDTRAAGFEDLRS